MITAIETYLAVRRAAGFTLSNTGYLLRSFANFATNQSKRTSAQQPLSTGPAKPDRSHNDTSATRPCASSLNTSAWKTPGTNRRR